MFITVINDCHDANAMARQSTRLAALFNSPVTTVGIKSYNELEAATHLIDVLDAGMGSDGVVLVNVAPRHGKGKKWPNGTPFAYFWYRRTLVISSVDGLTLSLVKKLNLTQNLALLDLPEVIAAMIAAGRFNPQLKDHLINTQFRSFEFTPRVARWLMDGITLPQSPYPITQIETVTPQITFIDNFGNCPTSILPEDIAFEPGKTITTKVGDLTCYFRLKDVPDGQPGLIIGSWGIETKRFIALVVQGKSAAETFQLQIGSALI